LQPDDDSYDPSISADGRYVAFQSRASNLVVDDANGAEDIFVHDRQTGLTQRVSVDSADGAGNGGSGSPSISADGRYVVFHSYASNLVTGDTNSTYDVFVRDLQTGLTERVSISSTGAEADDSCYDAGISADGRYVAFQSYASNLVTGDTNGHADIFVHDRQTGLTQRVSVDSAGVQASKRSRQPVISAGGRYVAFETEASNLVSNDTNGEYDIFVHDLQTGQTTRASVNADGVQGNYDSFDPSISADGLYVAFHSCATDLVDGATRLEYKIYIGPADAAAAVNGQWVSLENGQTVTGVDIGSFQSASILGRKFEDLDYDGLKDAGEPGLDAWTIELVDPLTGETIDTRTTSDGGYYSFIGLRPGDYEVREVGRDGWVQTLPGADAYLLTLVSGDAAIDIDFGNIDAGSISGWKFEDFNGDGLFDAGESGVNGFLIELADPLTGNVIAVQTTSGSGFYSFAGLLPGNYEVREGAHDEWRQTLPADLAPYSIALGYGEDLNGFDFGNQRLPGEVTGQVFEDLNANNVRDPGETGLSGWTIELVNSSTGVLVDTTVTSSVDLDGSGEIDPETETGLYSFTGVYPTVYNVVQIGPDGWVRVGSQADNRWLLVTGGQALSGVDFANYNAASISGVQFEDTSGDGIRDGGEPGVGGWAVELVDLSTGLVIETAVTDGDGEYSFIGLLSGDYEVRQAPLNGWVRTLPADPAYPITLAYTEDRDGIDFASRKAPGIHGRKFSDYNNSGIHDPGEPGLDGWTIELFDGFDALIATAVTTSIDLDGSGDINPVYESGLYSFPTPPAVGDDSYIIREVNQLGWSPVSPASGQHEVIVVSGESASRLDFGNHDTVAPVVTVDSVTADNVRPRLTGTVNDPDADVRVSLDGYGHRLARNDGDGTWTLDEGLIDPLWREGSFNLRAIAIDRSGNVGIDNTNKELTIDIPTQVVARRVFYNNSELDAAGDDGAIDYDKEALLPGETASPANYTSYSRGINGIMIDVNWMDTGYAPIADDFRVRIYDADIRAWVPGPEPIVTVRPGEGAGGSDRVTLTWPDWAIVNTWVEITVKSDANGGGMELEADDVFYFGNSVGDCDGDGAVGDGDYDILVSEFGLRGDGLAADINGDRQVDLADFVSIRARYGETVVFSPAPVTAPQAAVEPIAEAAASAPPIVSQPFEDRYMDDDIIATAASAPAVDLLAELPVAPSCISAVQQMSNDSPAKTLHRATMGEADLRALGDDLVTEGEDELLADILAESALTLRL